MERIFLVFHETRNLPCFTRVHEKSTALQCEFCDKGFSDKSKLKRHVSSVHEGKRPHKCDICGSCFTQKSHMDGHVAAVHGKKSDEYQIKAEDMLDSEQTVFSQEEFYIKEETFENEGEIEENYDFHEEKHDFDDKHGFDEKYDFEQDNHDFDVKQEEKTLDNTETYECDFCDKTFSRPDNVARHIKTVHEGKKPYTCEECGRNFTEKRNLEHHNESYHAPRKLKVVTSMCFELLSCDMSHVTQITLK